MKANIESRLDRLDRKLADLRSTLAVLPESFLSQSPEPGAWSPLMVAEHLRKAEAISGAYLRKKALSDRPLPRRDLRSRFREMAMGWYLRSPFKFKAPAIVNEESFPDQLILPIQFEQWEEERKNLREWLSRQPEDYFSRQGYRHPLAGRMTVNGMLKFFEWHFDRHRKQIDRTIRRLQGPNT